MSTTIESLELEIQSSSQSAEGGLDALTKSLEKLKVATKGGAGLTSVKNQIKAISDATKGIESGSINNLNNLTQAVRSLSSLNGIKLSSTISTQIAEIGISAKTLSGVDFAPISNLANSLQPLAAMGKINLTSAINQLSRIPELASSIQLADIGGFAAKIRELVVALLPLTAMPKQTISSSLTQLKKLPEIFKGLQSVDMGAFAAKIRELTAAIRPLADEMNKVAAGFSAFPAKIQRLIQSTNSLGTANRGAAGSYINLYAKLRMAITAVSGIGRGVAKCIGGMNTYIENINLFNASMGQYAEEAQNYAEKVGEAMGIDPGEWMRNQGVFMTLATGFGVTSERANIMSKNLTQLGYDLSSFFNISYSDAMQKLQSGLSGELEPLRRLGYDLSQARLEAVALSLGIDKSFKSMTQAEKSQLRYYAIMKQVTVAQGDMARTLNAPANQLRILKSQMAQAARAIGSIFIPALNAILPYAIAVAKVIRSVASAIASLFGFEMPEVDYSGLSTVAGGAEDVSDAMDSANASAKKLQKTLLGMDEINKLVDNSDTIGSGGLGGFGGGDLGFELPQYDFLKDLSESRVAQIVKEMKEWLGLTEDIDSWSEFFDTKLGKILTTVTMIGVGLAAWKITKKLLTGLSTMKTTLGAIGSGVSIPFVTVGLANFLADMDKFRKYFEDFQQNGATFENVVGMISEFAGGIADACIVLGGNNKLAAAIKAVQGIGELVISVKDIAENGLNWNNALTAVRGLSNLAIAVGVFTGNLKLVGGAMIIQSFTTVIDEIVKNWDAIKKGDWSGVDKATMATAAIQALGGILTAFGVFSKIKKSTNIGKAATDLGEVATVTETVSKTSSKLTQKLTDLVKNLGLGVAIIAEVAAAAVLIVGAIWVLGVELEKVGIAWQPVIDNAKTVATAVGIGTGVLVAVGTATAALGKLGGKACGQIGIGIAVLAELGVATGLFIAEIWAIGKGLNEVGKAWQPVLNNGETIAKGIGLGTALLVGVGVVTAALGTATVASAGALPLAIGLGTAMLVELAGATVLFVKSLVAVSDELSDNLAPALNALNGKLPNMTTNMTNFVNFMKSFAGEVVRYTTVSSIAGLSATVDTIVGWFTQDPIKKMAKEVNKTSEQTADLNEKLKTANPELKTAVDLLGSYTNFIDELGRVAGKGGTVNLSEGLKVNLKSVGKDIVTGFNEGIKNKYSTIQKTITGWGEDVEKWFTGSSYGDINEKAFSKIAKNVADGFVKGFKDNLGSHNTSSTFSSMGATLIEALYSGMKKQLGSIKEWCTVNVINPFNSAMDGALTFTVNVKNNSSEWWKSVKNWWKSVTAGNSADPFTTSVKDQSKAWWLNVKDWWSGKVGNVAKFSTDVKNESKQWWLNVRTWWNERATAVSLKVNVVAGWRDFKKSLGIPSSIPLTFKLPRIGITWDKKEQEGFSISYPKSFYTYAQGGFPETGQMFVAREAGPELVGSIGRRTTVANNMQIVEGISQGVASANANQDAILRELLYVAKEILDKDNSAVITTESVAQGMNRRSTREGRAFA